MGQNDLYDNYTRFVNPNFDSAIVGISHDDRLIYSYNLMVADYMKQFNSSAEEAAEWIDFNTIRSLPYYENSPIVMMDVETCLELIEDIINSLGE